MGMQMVFLPHSPATSQPTSQPARCSRSCSCPLWVGEYAPWALRMLYLDILSLFPRCKPEAGKREAGIHLWRCMSLQPGARVSVMPAPMPAWPLPISPTGNHDMNQIISDMYGNQGARIPSALILAAGIIRCRFCKSACRDSLSWEDEG